MHSVAIRPFFEKAVAAIQAQIDPTSSVSHNERIVDRMGHARQFDIVIKGSFAGQTMLGMNKYPANQRVKKRPAAIANSPAAVRRTIMEAISESSISTHHGRSEKSSSKPNA